MGRKLEGSGNESYRERKVPGTKDPRNVCSPGTKVPENERARERKFQGPGTKGSGNKSSGNKSSGNCRSWGTKVLNRDLSFLGTKGLGYEKSVIPTDYTSTKSTVNPSQRRETRRSTRHTILRCD